MAQESPPSAEDEGRAHSPRRGVSWGATLAVAAILAYACSPDQVAVTPEPPTTSPPETPLPTSAVTNPPVLATSATTIAVPVVGTIGPKEFNLLWECDEIVGGGFGDLTFSCSSGTQLAIPELHRGYFNGVANFELNDQDEKISISMTASAYNGDCMWLLEGGAIEAPVEDGKSVIEGGVLIGTDRCDGLRLAYEVTWDEETLAFDMDGVVELIE